MNAALAKTTPAPISIGDPVFHVKFGNGIVVGHGRKNSVVVDFGDLGQKHIVRDFLEMRQRTAEIIAFPKHRIVRTIHHGHGVVVTPGAWRVNQSSRRSGAIRKGNKTCKA